MANARLAEKLGVQKLLEGELKRLKKAVRMGHEVSVSWLPGQIMYKNGHPLAEEVKEDIIIVYAEEPEEAVQLLRHGFLEWVLNQHTNPYRQLINSLIVLFEEQQYQKKEKIVDSLTRLLRSKEEC